MDFDELKKDYTLQQHEGRVQAALDSNKGMIEFSKMSLRGATILNGTAAVAIIYQTGMVVFRCVMVWWRCFFGCPGYRDDLPYTMVAL